MYVDNLSWCGDKSVINNIKTYINAAASAKDNIILKYIIVDNLNDNNNEVEDFLKLANNLGIKTVRIDIDYEKYKLSKNCKVPEHYFDLINHFNSLASELGLVVEHCNQVDVILEKNKKE